ncbi:DUF4267 domain-containing protein [Spirosoma foliorum]|uniref:DUF4267 domain-containing protein n=1 Tax=Spirosoma foliorum TaxID=2710596 RepID=A0A7G5GPG1_9BACT|nr:DUF4267 domain-containing protein [Spirosoma foliorum]QMW00753.1 DUF4267 domain-containing protein [Spirosoma foliorum]
MLNATLPLWAKFIGYFFGAGLIFIGARFLILPETAELGFGLLYAQPNESFHYIKGVRDLTSGLFFTVFTLAGWRKPLGALFLIGSIIPVADMIIVLTAPAAVLGTAWIHGLTALAAWVGGYFLLRQKS